MWSERIVPRLNDGSIDPMAHAMHTNLGSKNTGGSWFNVAHNTTSGKGNNLDGRKQPGIAGPRANGKGDRWFQDGAAAHGSKSSARKYASAMIAKIPLPLSRWIARSFKPSQSERAAA